MPFKNSPALQGRHTVCPFVEVVAGGHILHSVVSEESEKNPTPHSVHPVEPVSLLNSPGMQLAQNAFPIVAAYLPREQGNFFPFMHSCPMGHNDVF